MHVQFIVCVEGSNQLMILLDSKCLQLYFTIDVMSDTLALKYSVLLCLSTLFCSETHGSEVIRPVILSIG